jgi:hypothetical protein
LIVLALADAASHRWISVHRVCLDRQPSSERAALGVTSSRSGGGVEQRSPPEGQAHRVGSLAISVLHQIDGFGHWCEISPKRN